jgi:type II secretory pathway pseudopilin PulG
MIELVFSIALVIIVITGIVILMVNTVSSKNKGFNRKKAAELAEIVMEDLVNQKKNNPDEFWLLNNVSPRRWPSTEFDNYFYSVDFTNIIDASIGCGNATTDCTEVVVSIGWSGGSGGANQNANFSRFFSRKGN